MRRLQGAYLQSEMPHEKHVAKYMPAKRYPLPKRMNLALSEKAYANLRRLNERHHYGNNYLLTILLENIDDVVDEEALDHVFAEFKDEYGAPAAGGMKRN